MGTLEDKVVLVVGAAGAQGRAATELFAREGALVFAVDAAAAALEGVVEDARKAGGQVTGRALDVTDADDWAAVVSGVLDTYGRVDGLVNFAAVLSRPGVEATEPEAWDRTLAVNLTGAWLGMRAVLPVMRERGSGSVVNVGSVDGLVGRGGGAAYQASKGGLRLLSKSAATEYASHGVRVNSVHPGPMEARMVQVVGPRADAAGTAALEARLTAQVPMGRLGKALDIAWAVRFLLSDESAFVTGVDLPVDGGLTAQ